MLSDVSKQLTTLALATLLSLLLTACGGGGEEESGVSESSANASSNINIAKPDTVSSQSSSSSSPAPDTSPPSATNPQVYRISSTSITLKWQPSADNVAVSFYELHRNGSLIATIGYPDSSAQDNGLTASTTYSYTITSVDSSGNRSVRSSPLITKTLPGSIISTNSSSSSTASSENNTGGIGSFSSASSADNNKAQYYSWTHPRFRQNGDYLELDAIGGYEIRFKPTSNDDFIYLILEGNETTSFSADLIPTNSIVEIAVYDINGLYSEFVSIEPK